MSSSLVSRRLRLEILLLPPHWNHNPLPLISQLSPWHGATLTALWGPSSSEEDGNNSNRDPLKRRIESISTPLSLPPSQKNASSREGTQEWREGQKGPQTEGSACHHCSKQDYLFSCLSGMPRRAGSCPCCDRGSRVSSSRKGSASRREALEVNTLRMPENTGLRGRQWGGMGKWCRFWNFQGSLCDTNSLACYAHTCSCQTMVFYVLWGLCVIPPDSGEGV